MLNIEHIYNLKTQCKNCVFLFFTVSLFFSCNTKKKENKFSNEDIKEIIADFHLLENKSKFNPPPKHSSLDFYIRTSSDTITIVTPYQLYYIYKDTYQEKHPSFELFINYVINGDNVITIKEKSKWKKGISFHKKFYINNKDEMEKLLEKYFTKTSKAKISYNLTHKAVKKLNDSELNTMFYILSNNGYYIYYSCYSGSYDISNQL